MGGVLSTPRTDKRSNQGEGLGLKYGLSSMQGWRSEMEDAHDVQIGLRYGLDDWSYFAVFDGHAGKRAAAFAAWNLLEFILRDNLFKLDTDNLPEHVYIEPDLEKLHEIIKVVNSSSSNSNQLPVGEKQSNGEETAKSLDDSLNDAKSDVKLPTGGESTDSSTTQQNASSPTESSNEQPNKPKANETSQDIDATTTVKNEDKPVSKFVDLPTLEQTEIVEKAIRSGFLRIDQSMRDSAQDMSGSTAVCALISPTHLFIANCGDSRAVLWNGTDPVFVTQDHKPLNPTERTRIISAGGYATQRINGTLAVSRALGDFEFKKDQLRGPCEQLVSPEPEVTVIARDPEHTFLVLACDGIWDVMNNRHLCEFIEHKLKIERNVEDVCSAVLDACLHKGSRDNMSIIIVVFENGPKFSEEELARERENDEKLKELIRKYGERHCKFNDFLYRLKNRIFEMRDNDTIYLPPGVGLVAKHEMIQEIYEKEFQYKTDSDSDYE